MRRGFDVEEGDIVRIETVYEDDNNNLVEINVIINDGWCREGKNLRTERNQERNNALTRQLAANIEYDMKLSCIALNKSLQGQFTDEYSEREDGLDTLRIRHSSLKLLLRKLDHFQKEQYLQQRSLADQAELDRLVSSLSFVKDLYNRDVHPTCTLNGERADYQYCRSLVVDNSAVPEKDLLLQQMEILSQQKGSGPFLFDFGK